MSINWVMLSGSDGFIHLPKEHVIFTSPPRTSLSIKPPTSYSGTESPFLVSSSAGCIYLTNQRIVYLPSQQTPQLQSFAAPLLNIRDSHVSAPFFGPNVWTALVHPVSGGGIPPALPAVEIKVIFKEGGAFDFHMNFERIKDRLAQAVEQARERGVMTGDEEHTTARRAGASTGVDFMDVHLDELPAYDGPLNRHQNPPAHPPPASTLIDRSPFNSVEGPRNSSAATAARSGFEPPTEPPPGYEEAQQQGIADEFEMRIRRASTT